MRKLFAHVLWVSNPHICQSHPHFGTQSVFLLEWVDSTRFSSKRLTLLHPSSSCLQPHLNVCRKEDGGMEGGKWQIPKGSSHK